MKTLATAALATIFCACSVTTTTINIYDNKCVNTPKETVLICTISCPARYEAIGFTEDDKIVCQEKPRQPGL